MSRVAPLCLAALVTLASGRLSASGGQTPPIPEQGAAQATGRLLQRYCLGCHNQRLRSGGIALDTLDLTRVAGNAESWEKVIRRLRTASMPPQGRPRPDAATYDRVAGLLEHQLDDAAAAHPNPGPKPALHRLNRTEYQNAIRDLLALDNLPRELDIAVLLPPDDASYGFDNIADALGTSPTLLERYVTTAQKLSRLAVGDPTLPLIVDTYRVSPSLPQEDRFDGLPFGTRGGISITRHFPVDGEYVIRVALGGGRAADAHQLELRVDGERVETFAIAADAGRGRGRPPQGGVPPDGAAVPPPLQVRRVVKAGERTVTATFVKKTSALTEEVVRPFSRSGQAAAPQQPSVASVTISGPYNPTGAGDTASRRRLFVCRPAGAGDERHCAREILSTVARRAYRRPVTEADLQTLMPFYEAGRAEKDFETGIERGLERVLVSPAFLFRIEREPAGAGTSGGPSPVASARAGIWAISDLELASRLSFFLWSSIPDDELLDVAVRGRLRDPATLEQQVRRMLADGRARALVDNFAGQWLFLRNVDAASPDPRLFPNFDDALRRAMRRETELFVEDVVRENRSVTELLTANYTFVNERLAKHYGISNIYGDHFRRVMLPDGTARRGLLGHASVLTVTSYAHRTSPVLRGKWMLENILGAPPPPPPPDVPALDEKSQQTGRALTMRAAMEQHRANPACASCHARMDPLGFAFENFDAVGRWRTESAQVPVDASGALPDGTRFDGVPELLQALLRDPGQFVGTLTERLLTYAVGRGTEYYDAPAVRRIVRDAAPGGYRFDALVLGIVKSTPFQMRSSSPAALAREQARSAR